MDTLEELSQAQLAALGCEYMLVAQFNSRTGYSALQIAKGAVLHQTRLENPIDLINLQKRAQQ